MALIKRGHKSFTDRLAGVPDVLFGEFVFSLITKVTSLTLCNIGGWKQLVKQWIRIGSWVERKSSTKGAACLRAMQGMPSGLRFVKAWSMG
jgi:hypothetical protein